MWTTGDCWLFSRDKNASLSQQRQYSEGPHMAAGQHAFVVRPLESSLVNSHAVQDINASHPRPPQLHKIKNHYIDKTELWATYKISHWNGPCGR